MIKQTKLPLNEKKMTKKRLLVITDSTGLPRPEINLSYEDIYIYGLTEGIDVELRFYPKVPEDSAHIL